MSYFKELKQSGKALLQHLSSPSKYKSRRVNGITIPGACQIKNGFKLAIKKGFNFKLRSTPTEFTWGFITYYILMKILDFVVRLFIDKIGFKLITKLYSFFAVDMKSAEMSATIAWLILYLIVIFILWLPLLSLIGRRLRDIHVSKVEGTLTYLLMIIPIIDVIILIILAISPSYEGKTGKKFVRNH